ncbi:MAG TPA: nicotinate (nicotinamide) nucleotide adenylyltransferase [Candidatus Caccenecus avistercoris]|nr:nicotinate (nicotinamide) nucleotide adenylyltransferase [Candidatus Caccenecus avistercoris]
MKIGIFGGSFNPPHVMHKNLALYLIKNKYLDKVIYVPTGNKYVKKDLIDVKYRLEMLKLMVEDIKDLEVSAYERKKALIYTYQTLDYFKKLYPNDEIYFVCGSDNLREIKSWKNYKYILNNYKLLVVKRSNDDIEEMVGNLKSKNVIAVNIPCNIPISSSIIRKNIKLNQNFEGLDLKVKKYIEKKNLYCRY